MKKKIEFKSITFPEISLRNFCTCGKDDCGKDVGVAIEIIAEIPKDELGNFVDMLNSRQGFNDDDIPVRVTIEPIKK